MYDETYVRLAVQHEGITKPLPYVIQRGQPINHLPTHFPTLQLDVRYSYGSVITRNDLLFACIEEHYCDRFYPDKWGLIDPYLYFVKPHREDKEYHPGTIVEVEGNLYINEDEVEGVFNPNEWSSLTHGKYISTCHGYIHYGNGASDFKQLDFKGTVLELPQ